MTDSNNATKDRTVIKNYRNTKTGELAPPHRLGTDEGGRTIYLFVDGWEPVDAHGNVVDVECDADGNWLV